MSGPSGQLAETIARNLRCVRVRMARACERAGRDPGAIRLVGISKTFPVGHVRAAAAAGLTDLGENRVQEALEKISDTADVRGIAWHLVGHLQSNKARRAAAAMAWIQSVDSVGLLRRLDHAAAAERTTPQLLIQVDLAGERTKHGAPAAAVLEILDAGTACGAVDIRGLMVLPPWSADPEQARPWFRQLRELRDRLVDAGARRAHLRELSMGMSHDFDVAIEEGATIIRVGTAIFGRREPRRVAADAP